MARLAWTTVALLVLLALTVGSSFLALGAGNVLANLGIAAAKAALIAAVFMQLTSAGKLVRMLVTIVVLWLALLFGLTLADRFTRPEQPGGPPDVVPPRQVAARPAGSAAMRRQYQRSSDTPTPT